MRGLYDKLGITKDFVTRGPNGLIDSDYFDYTPEQWEAFTTQHWRRLRGLGRRHRPLPPQDLGRDRQRRPRPRLDRRAGARARADRSLGTFDDAVRIAKEKAGIPAPAESSSSTIRSPRACSSR